MDSTSLLQGSSLIFKAAIGSTHPVKVAALSSCVERVCSYKVDSRVPAQPIGEKQTRQGAKARALAAWKCAKREQEEVLFSVGLEGGIEWGEEEGAVNQDCKDLFLINWGALYAPFLQEPQGQGGSIEAAGSLFLESCGPRLALPSRLREPLARGMELKEILPKELERFSRQQQVRREAREVDRSGSWGRGENGATYETIEALQQALQERFQCELSKNRTWSAMDLYSGGLFTREEMFSIVVKSLVGQWLYWQTML